MEMKGEHAQSAAEEAAYVYSDCCLEAEDVLELTCGDIRTVWVNLEEGFNGDYNPDDPDDKNLLRLDLYQRLNGEWESVEGASYCTRMPVDADESLLKRSLRYALDNYRVALSGRPGFSVRHVGETLSWMDPDYDFSQPLPNLFGM